MQYNKYQDQYSAIDTRRSTLSRNVEELEGTQKWHKQFNLSVAATDLGNAKRSAAQFANETVQLEPEASQKRAEVTHLEERASIGWNPKYWFSAERATIKDELKKQLAELVALESRLDSLKTQTKSQSSIVAGIESDLKKYRQHDSLACDAEIGAKKQEISALSSQLSVVEQQRNELDARLSAPLAELSKLTSQRSRVAADVSRAQTMDDQMSRAANSFERAQIHEKCKQTLGEASPRRVINAKGRELESLDRNITKLQMRLNAIAEKSSRTIRRLVIDGNNMCYLHSPRKFLGKLCITPPDLCSRTHLLL